MCKILPTQSPVTEVMVLNFSRSVAIWDATFIAAILREAPCPLYNQSPLLYIRVFTHKTVQVPRPSEQIKRVKRHEVY